MPLGSPNVKDVIVRYLTGDQPEMADAATALFVRAEAAWDEQPLILTEVTLAKVVWVLQRLYRFKKGQITDALLTFMELPGLRVIDKARLQQALYLYQEMNLGFGDALLASRALTDGPAAIYAFDRHFSRVEAITHLKPF